MTLSRKTRLEQARAQAEQHKVLLETFETGQGDRSAGVLREQSAGEPMRQETHPSLPSSLREGLALSEASTAPAPSPAPVLHPPLPGSLPMLTVEGAVVSSGEQLLALRSAPLSNPVALPASPSVMASVVEQMRLAAKSFDRWRVTRHHIGVRVMHQSKARLRRITKRLGVKSMGAALDYLLADAEQRLFGVLHEE